MLDEAGAKLEAFEISHSHTGFEAAHERLSKHAVLAEDVRLAIETQDSLLVDFLLECGYRLYFLNPRQTDRFRDRHRMSSSKSDSFDAFVLADAVRTDPHLFNALSPLDEESFVLRVLTRTREGLTRRKVAISNELTAALKRYFPLALELFSALDTPKDVSFLLKYPSYAQARTVSEAGIADILREQGAKEKAALRKAGLIRAKLTSPQPTPSASVAKAYPVAVKSLLRQMRSVLDELKAIEDEIREAYKNHPNKPLLDSLPGVASTLGPVLAAELGSDLSRFSDIRTLKAFAGSCPVTIHSGKYCEVRYRRACNRRVRQALHMASQSAITCCGWARELYDRRPSEGKSYGRALRAVANQLVEIIYAILQTRTPYSEAYHLQMKEAHSPRILTEGVRNTRRRKPHGFSIAHGRACVKKLR